MDIKNNERLAVVFHFCVIRGSSFELEPIFYISHTLTIFTVVICDTFSRYWLRWEASHTFTHSETLGHTYSFSRERRKYGVFRELPPVLPPSPPPPPPPPLLPPFCGLRRRMPLVRLRERGTRDPLLLLELWRCVGVVVLLAGLPRLPRPVGAAPAAALLRALLRLSALLPPLLFKWGTLEARRTMTRHSSSTG